MPVGEMHEQRLAPALARGGGEGLDGAIGAPRPVPGLVADRRDSSRSVATAKQGHGQPAAGRGFERAQAGALGDPETDAITLVDGGVDQCRATPSRSLEATYE